MFWVLTNIQVPDQHIPRGIINSIIPPPRGVPTNIIDHIRPPPRDVPTNMIDDIRPPPRDVPTNMIDDIRPPPRDVPTEMIEKIGPPPRDLPTEMIEKIGPPPRDLPTEMIEKIGPPPRDLPTEMIEKIGPPPRDLPNNMINQIGPPPRDLPTNMIDKIHPPPTDLPNNMINQIGPPPRDLPTNMIDKIHPPPTDVPTNMINDIHPPPEDLPNLDEMEIPVTGPLGPIRNDDGYMIDPNDLDKFLDSDQPGTRDTMFNARFTVVNNKVYSIVCNENANKYHIRINSLNDLDTIEIITFERIKQVFSEIDGFTEVNPVIKSVRVFDDNTRRIIYIGNTRATAGPEVWEEQGSWGMQLLKIEYDGNTISNPEFITDTTYRLCKIVTKDGLIPARRAGGVFLRDISG